MLNILTGTPANFLDLGGGVKENQVYEAFRIVTSDPNVKGILVNIFGGIVNCATIANGIVSAFKNINLSVPLIVRLEGKSMSYLYNFLFCKEIEKYLFLLVLQRQIL